MYIRPNTVLFYKHVSTYRGSASAAQFVYKTYWGRNIHYASPQNSIKIIKNC